MSDFPTETGLHGLLECLLLVHQDPLSPGEIARVYGLDRGQVEEAFLRLIEGYASDPERGLQIVEVAGGYQLRTRPAYAEPIKKFFKAKPQRLSQAAYETLAIIAYRQPILRSDIERIRGVDCGATLRNLLDRGLVKILGKKELPGRPLIYTTTKKFLEVFNLTALSQLPSLKELGEIEGGPPNLELFPDQDFRAAEEAGEYPSIDTQEPPPSRLGGDAPISAEQTWDSEGQPRVAVGADSSETPVEKGEEEEEDEDEDDVEYDEDEEFDDSEDDDDDDEEDDDEDDEDADSSGL